MPFVAIASANAMLSAISSFFSVGVLDVLKWILFGVFFLSTCAVVLGVYWDSDRRDEHVRHRGWLILVVALAIETLSGGAIFVIDSVIQNWLGDDIATLNGVANTAKNTANGATNIAKGTRIQLEGQKREIGSLERRATNIANAESGISNRLTIDEADRARMKKEVASRKIEPRQAKKIESVLRGRIPGFVNLYVLDDPEAINFAGAINSTLHEGGVIASWVDDISQPRPGTFEEFPWGIEHVGVTIWERGKGTPESIADRLLGAFKTAGFSFKESHKDLPREIVSPAIFVGLKSPPFMQPAPPDRGVRREH